MKDVKNLNGKLVCRIDDVTGTVEIVHKGFITLISLKPDGTIVIQNTKAS